ncbi:MAG: hypothetical protein WBM07_04330, partial [Chitinivibrionales bacterium]
MNKKCLVHCVILAIIIMVTVSFADLFPAREGNWWLYSFTTDTSLAGASKFDSGTVQWQVTQNSQGNDTYWITILQQKNLVRSKTTLVTYPPVIFDSLFDPPRSTFDTLTLTGKYTSNGLVINNDNCYPLIHQPLCWTTAPCTLSTVAIAYHGKSITGYIIDPISCPLPACSPQVTFTQADGIGLVAYESKSPSQSVCVTSPMTSEQWTLVDYRAANQWISPDTVGAGSAVTLTLSTLEYTCVPDSIVKSIALDSKGITLVYRPVYNPAADCMPWYGTTYTIGYQFTAPSAGKYPVFIESQPSCAPLCQIASVITCIDTLVVKGPASISPRAVPSADGTMLSLRKNNGLLEVINAESFNGREARLLDASGRLLDQANIVGGKAIFQAKKLSTGRVVFIVIDNHGCK